MNISKLTGSLGKGGFLAAASLLTVLSSANYAAALPCLNDKFGGDTNCTANDFTAANITVTQVLDDGCVGPGDTFTFNGTMTVGAGSANRYDVGFFIAADGANALTGTCSVAVMTPIPSDPADDDDSCGDYSGTSTVVPLTNVTAACVDTNSDGFFDLAICSAWDQNASNNCNGAADITPGTKSKCDCVQAETDVAAPHCEDDATLCVDDGNPCTNTVCNPRGSGLGDVFGCSNVNNTAPCNDGLFCNGADVCAGGVCGHAGNPCAAGDVCGDNCNEAADNCFDLAGTVCRASAGACDVAETCTGSTAACPPNGFQNGNVCRASAGICDAAETCSGSSANCPADGFAAGGTSCRASTGECDVAETCTGSGASCPADGFQAAGTACTSDGNVCTDDECDGSGACLNTANTDPCDDGAFCTENDVCSGGSCAGSAIDCSDAIDCTDDSCNEATDQCDHGENDANCDDLDACTADTCSIAQNGCVSDFVCGTDICRSPGYWSTHSGYEKKDSINIGQLLIDTVGPIEVCGQTISATSNGSSPYLAGLGLTSNLEGLCMKTKGVKQRQLYRQLVAAAFNCEVSGGGADCDAILGKHIDASFSDCSDLCAGNPVVDGPSTQQCVSQLNCFNNGGEVIDGKCAYGTCASQPGIYCGGAYGSCPDFDLLPQECVDFQGNCHAAALCNEGLDFCPKSTPASSSAACREARGNGCTIDSCN